MELFDVCVVDFIGPFPSLFNNQFILVTMDYVPKWVKAVAFPINDFRMVVKFLRKNIFTWFGVPRAIISEWGNHFYNQQHQSVLTKYEVSYKVATLYNP